MHTGVRSIARATSKDFIHWTAPVVMEANQPGEHLYTNGTHPYFRAPHVYVALPTRFMANRSSITDVVFMVTRPGAESYTRLFKEAFIRPGLGKGGWGNRSNYIAWHVVPTSDTQMSMYNVNGDHYVMRIDGFISVHAGAEEGELITKPLTFEGNQLEINESTSAAGRIRVEIQDAAGRPVPGYTLEASESIFGDRISHVVTWGDDASRSADVSRLAGKPIRLRLVMQEADLFAIRFHGNGAPGTTGLDPRSAVRVGDLVRNRHHPVPVEPRRHGDAVGRVVEARPACEAFSTGHVVQRHQLDQAVPAELPTHAVVRDRIVPRRGLP
jgi:hypothetical protein